MSLPIAVQRAFENVDRELVRRARIYHFAAWLHRNQQRMKRQMRRGLWPTRAGPARPLLQLVYREAARRAMAGFRGDILRRSAGASR